MKQLNEFLVKNNTAPKLSNDKIFNEILADWHKEEDGVHKIKEITVITKFGYEMNWYAIWKFLYSNPDSSAAEIAADLSNIHPLPQILDFLVEKGVIKNSGKSYSINMPDYWKS